MLNHYKQNKMGNLTQKELKLFFQNAAYYEKKQVYPKLMKRALTTLENEISLSFLYELNPTIFIENLSELLTTSKEENIKNLQSFFKQSIKDPALFLNLYMIYKDLDENKKELKEFLLKEIESATILLCEAEDYSILMICFNFKKDDNKNLKNLAEECLKNHVFSNNYLYSTLSEMAKEKESISDILDFCSNAIWKDAIIPCRALSEIEKQILPPDNASDKRIKEFLDLKEILEGISLKIIEKYPISDLDKLKNLFDMTWRMKAIYTQCKCHGIEKGIINTMSRLFFDRKNDCDLKVLYTLLEYIHQQAPAAAKMIPSLVNTEIQRHEILNEEKTPEAQAIIALCVSILTKEDNPNDYYSVFKKAIRKKWNNPKERDDLRCYLKRYATLKAITPLICVVQQEKNFSYPKENIKDFIDAWWLNSQNDMNLDSFRTLLKIMKEMEIQENFFQNDTTFQAWKDKVKKADDEAQKEIENLQTIRQKIENIC